MSDDIIHVIKGLRYVLFDIAVPTERLTWMKQLIRINHGITIGTKLNEGFMQHTTVSVKVLIPEQFAEEFANEE